MNGGNLRGRFFFALSFFFMVALLVLAACDKPERLRSNAELGLNDQQARGRALYDLRCAGCHEPYRKKELNGPTMVGVFKKPFLPSGMRASDERVGDIVMMGKPKMPAFGNVLTQDELRDLLAYMHTL